MSDMVWGPGEVDGSGVGVDKLVVVARRLVLV